MTVKQPAKIGVKRGKNAIFQTVYKPIAFPFKNWIRLYQA